MTEDDIRAEFKQSYLGEGVRGKYYERYRKGFNPVKLDDDVPARFPTSAAANEALRSLIQR